MAIWYYVKRLRSIRYLLKKCERHKPIDRRRLNSLTNALISCRTILKRLRSKKKKKKK